MNRIWWFGKIDMLYNELVPEVEPDMVNRIILTMQHGMNHNDQNCITAVGTTMPPYEDLSYIIQNMCRLTTSRIRPDPSLRLMSLHALRVIQHYFGMSNTLILVAEYVQTTVPIDWILADHLIGLLHIIQKMEPHILDININRLHEVVLSDVICVRFLLEKNHIQITRQFSLAVDNGYTKTVRTMLVYVDPRPP